MAAKVYDNLTVNRPFTWKGQPFTAGAKFDATLTQREYTRLVEAKRVRVDKAKTMVKPAPKQKAKPKPRAKRAKQEAPEQVAEFDPLG